MRPWRWLLALNVVLIVLWLVLRTLWFDGSIGCDDSDPPSPPDCDVKGDVIAYLGWGEAALLVVTLGWFAVRVASMRRRCAD